MKERLAVLLSISSMMLLMEPYVNYPQFYTYLLEGLKDYWPIILICISMEWIGSKSKKTNKR